MSLLKKTAQNILFAHDCYLVVEYEKCLLVVRLPALVREDVRLPFLEVTLEILIKVFHVILSEDTLVKESENVSTSLHEWACIYNK